MKYLLSATGIFLILIGFSWFLLYQQEATMDAANLFATYLLVFMVFSIAAFFLTLQFGPAFYYCRHHRSRAMGAGKGLMIGAIMAFVANVLFFILRKQFSHCTDWCGVDQMALGFIQPAMFFLGLIVYFFAALFQPDIQRKLNE